MKRKILLFTAAAICTAALTACQSNGAATAPEGKEKGEESKQTELNMFFLKPENIDVLEEIAKDFMDEHPDVKITMQHGTKEQLLSRIATNDIPDVLQTWPSQTLFQNMMAEGLLMDLSDQECVKRMLDTIRTSTKHKDGKDYAVSVTINSGAMFYNQGMFEELEIEEPKTLDDLWTACDKMKEAGITPFACPDKDVSALGNVFDRFIGSNIDHEFYKISEKVAAGEDSYKNHPELKQYLEVYLKIRENTDGNSLGTSPDDMKNAFANGKVGIILGGTYDLSLIQSLNPELKVGWMYFPEIIEGVEAWPCGSVDTAVSVSAATKYPEAALEFVEYFVSPEVAQKYADADKNPNLIKGVKVDVPQFETLTKDIEDGKFASMSANEWPPSLRNEVAIHVQQMIMDKDIEAFLGAFDEVTKECYENQ
ncbi:extracellular solute-binding protein [Lachnospiraceae bacterium 62-35]